MIAITRPVSPTLAHCELTHVAREPIDRALAQAQHDQYENALRSSGAEVIRLPSLDELPDSVFVEDTAVVLDEIAILTRPGAQSRRDEVESVRDALAKHRTVSDIEAPATVDGGDVLVLDREVLVGLTPRTTISGMQRLRALLAPFGYDVRPIPVRGCLHLKSAVTRAGPKTLVANPSWVDPALIPGWDIIPVDPREPSAANVLWLGDATIVSEAFVRTNAILARLPDIRLVPVPASELAKAEGGVTCCCLVIRD
jgi:dimethylargininase